ncbi:HpcH/HpaI aldolase/citrate lyase family protein [Pseudoduganella albidiflava]|uniref:ATP-binding protein n=1 Tax=Pseudoduganella albidiflava TaxID=321983 RepID=A0A411X3D6_9BURK|nr:HpcH/HpaI aldolase/citrate lyase family protein [Pseudoduganella albidiflava]QBI03527.1 ATP-binding protein [Pseudoduganella albidiflava]GGY50750.1 ATP-binding protein [Pseudoduganella albidiflava]
MHDKPIGASLYVPTTHRHLLEIANGERIAALRSVIFCTEDAVAERELEAALANLAATLRAMRAEARIDRFVRVRNTGVLARVLAMDGVEKLAGFVIPKATRDNLDEYIGLLSGTRHLLMPTLETAEVFDPAEMRALRVRLSMPDIAPRILALRIGGNDLLALLGLRRPRDMTIYQSPLGPVIASLVTTFRPYGFRLTSPVFEHLDCPALMAQEVQQDIAYGMVGKTAIHPSQIEPIEQHFRVQPKEVAMALRILDRDAPAVFKLDDSMCEVATHRNWANAVIARASRFGTHAVAAGTAGNDEPEAPVNPVAHPSPGWTDGDKRVNGSAFAK